jgi:hypothetical protein
MLRWWRVLFALALCLNLSLCSDIKSKDLDEREEALEAATSLSLRVVTMTSKNFATSVGDGNVWLIEFYTPWCVRSCVCLRIFTKTR